MYKEVINKIDKEGETARQEISWELGKKGIEAELHREVGDGRSEEVTSELR